MTGNNINAAARSFRSVMLEQEKAKKTLGKSIENLEDAFVLLGLPMEL